jgi:integral membrane protein (TIGR01906 family)
VHYQLSQEGESALVQRALLALLVVAVPLFLVTLAVVWAVNDLRLYRYEFRLQKVSGETGISESQLMSAVVQIRGYFNSRKEPLDVRIELSDQTRSLFNEREAQHMRDVKRLVWGVYLTCWVAFAYLLGWLVAGLVSKRRLLLRKGAVQVLWGCGLTVVPIVGIGLAAWVAFDAVFVLFHRISFANDLWQLDPTTDYLIRIFPERFWSDATFFVGLAAIAMAAVLAMAVAAWLWVTRRRAQEETDPTANMTKSEVV